MSIEIVACETAELRATLFAFRYRVWGGELGADVPVGAPDQMREAVDDVATNYAALDNGEIVGSLRVIDFRLITDPAPVVERYGIGALLDHIGAACLSYVGRLAVDRSRRGGLCMLKLLERAFEDGRRRGIRATFFDCSPYLLSMYESLGAIRSADAFNDPVLGFKLPVVMMLGDVEYFREVGSPYLRIAQQYPRDNDLREWRLRHLRAPATVASAPPEALADLIERRLQVELAREHHLLAGLSHEQLARVLASAATFEAASGDEVIKAGLKEAAVFVLLDGLVEVVKENNEHFVLATLGSGEFFGEMAYLTGAPRRNKVIARAPSEILVISADVLRHLRQREPAIYATLMHNIASALADRLLTMSHAWYGGTV